MNDRLSYRVWSVQEQKYRYYNLLEKESLYDFGYFAEDETPDYDEQVTLNDNDRWALIVEQCTGLKDKNGKLIYEGDIVTDGVNNFVVVWNYNAWCIQTDKFEHFLTSGFEIIGNIHDNKELLDD